MTQDFSPPSKPENLDSNQRDWHRYVTLSTLILAIFTALGALLSGISANQSMVERTAEIIDISLEASEQVKAEILKSKVEILVELGETPDPADLDRIERFAEEIRQYEEDYLQEVVKLRLTSSAHLILAIAVTVLSIGITLNGMSVLLGEKLLWVVGIIFGALGILGVIFGAVRLLL